MQTKMTKSSFILPLFLSGCMGIYEGGFECPPGEGTKCKSISEVNELVNQGQLPPKSPEKSQEHQSGSCAASTELSETSCSLTPDHLVPAIWWSPLLTRDTPRETRKPSLKKASYAL